MEQDQKRDARRRRTRGEGKEKEEKGEKGEKGETKLLFPENGLSSLFISVKHKQLLTIKQIHFFNAQLWRLTAKAENVVEIKDYLSVTIRYFKFFIDNTPNYELVRPILGIISSKKTTLNHFFNQSNN